MFLEIKPTILTDLEGKTVQKGEPCELTIIAEGKPQPQCKWTLNNQDLTLIPGEIESIVDENDNRIYHLRIHFNTTKTYRRIFMYIIQWRWKC